MIEFDEDTEEILWFAEVFLVQYFEQTRESARALVRRLVSERPSFVDADGIHQEGAFGVASAAFYLLVEGGDIASLRDWQWSKGWLNPPQEAVAYMLQHRRLMEVPILSIDEFLQGLTADSLERQYHHALVDVISRVRFDASSEAQGLGLMHLLTDGHLVTATLDTYVHPIAGSADENAYMISALFSAAHRAPSWWTSHYAARKSGSDVVEASRWWVRMLRDVPGVVDVSAC